MGIKLNSHIKSREIDEGTERLLQVLLESDPPTFQGYVDNEHLVYAWPGKRTPIFYCMNTGGWYSTWLYNGQAKVCLECLKVVNVRINPIVEAT